MIFAQHAETRLTVLIPDDQIERLTNAIPGVWRTLTVDEVFGALDAERSSGTPDAPTPEAPPVALAHPAAGAPLMPVADICKVLRLVKP